MAPRSVAFPLLAVLAFGGITPPAPAARSTLQAIADRLDTAVVVSGLSAPVGIVNAGDARLFVLEQSGVIRIVSGGQLVAHPFLDLRDRVLSGGERGLLGLAFHPDFAHNGRLFVDYTRQPDGATVIARFDRLDGDPDRADPSSEAILLVVEQPFSNHNGGQLQFGPDGMLYVALGDGGSADDPFCNAQRSDSLLGKLLRLDVDQGAESPPYYGVPPDNPFAGPGGFADEVWALGLRNPWRVTFDRMTGDLLIGDVGQGSFEEVDFAPQGAQAGRNYGWRFMEGDSCRNPAGGQCPIGLSCFHPSFTAPVVVYPHGTGDCSITGGYVYRGSDIPDLYGDYLFGDFCSGAVRLARNDGGVFSVEPTAVVVPRLTSFGEDANGEIYLVALDGVLRRLMVPEPPSPGILEATVGSLRVDEGVGTLELSVRRRDGAAGDVSVMVRAVGQSASFGEDFQPASRTLRWADGADGTRSASFTVLDDTLAEDEETFGLVLDAPTGGATLGEPSAVEVTIVDDDPPVLECVVDGRTLCLDHGRFRAEVAWRSADGSGTGHALPITDRSGAFTFFRPDNVELLVKVLDACSGYDRFWVFVAGLTNVETTLVVTDTANGQQREYRSALGVAYPVVTDTGAFASCP